MDFGRSSALAAALSTLLQCGLSLPEVLPLMTTNVARLLRLHNKGAIAVGMDADLVVLDAETCVDSVMVNGQWHRRKGIPLKRGRFES